jgi:hypothetical protein
MKILNFNKFKFLNESFSDFNQYDQQGMSPSSMGMAGYGFAVDNRLNQYGSQDSPYLDQYARTPALVNQLLGVIKQVNKDTVTAYGNIKYDQFLEDVDELTDFKILRINKNASQTIDVYISFYFGDEEFYGVFKNFNNIQKDDLKTDLYTDNRFSYIDKEYRLKLNNYFRKILDKWFRPKKGSYVNLKDKVYCRGKMGNTFSLPKNAKIEVQYSNDDKDGNSYIQFLYKNETYVINKNDYYYFNYWFEKIEDIKKHLI